MRVKFALSFIAFLTVAVFTAAFGAEDSAIDEIEKSGYHYTFQIDSSYTPWNYNFPDSDRFISDRSISDDGSTVVIKAMKSYRDRYHDFYIFSDGTLTTVFDSVHDVTTNRSGDKLIVAPKPIDWCQDSSCKVSCYDVYGNFLWGPVLFSEQPMWSPDDQLVGLFSGVSFLNVMPAFFGDLLNTQDALDFAGTEYATSIYSNNGTETDRDDHTVFGGAPYIQIACFHNDFKGYISYLLRWKRGSGGIKGFENPSDDTLKIFEISDGEFALTNEVVPFEIPDSFEVGRITNPSFTWASFDNRIYGIWGVSSALASGERIYLKQYVCFDSTGNLLWRQYDTNRAHAHYYSESGRYLIETKVGNNGLIILRRTEDNEILFQMDYPDAGGLLLADIKEHPETGHIFVYGVDKSGNSVILYPDGTLADFSMLGLRLCNSPDFAIQKDGTNITFYKVRW